MMFFVDLMFALVYAMGLCLVCARGPVNKMAVIKRVLALSKAIEITVLYQYISSQKTCAEKKRRGCNNSGNSFSKINILMDMK